MMHMITTFNDVDIEINPQYLGMSVEREVFPSIGVAKKATKNNVLKALCVKLETGKEEGERNRTSKSKAAH
jgi:hypothetical protein